MDSLVRAEQGRRRKYSGKLQIKIIEKQRRGDEQETIAVEEEGVDGID
jgi:hypothetical protein